MKKQIMRFKISTHIEKSTFGNQLPINYPYLLASWIYGVIAKDDAEYAAWLHDNAFKDGSKIFKLFTFSDLKIRDFSVEDDRMCIHSDKVSFYLSFLPERSTKGFIKGLFHDQCFTLGDKYSKVQLVVQQIELIPPPDFSKIDTFKTLSPVVVSIKDGRRNMTYISPEREDYAACLQKNLKEKYRIYYDREFTGSDEFEFELLSAPKPRLITIKADTPNQTRVKGYIYNFRLKADEELLKLAYEGGLAEKGSLGFGMIGVKSLLMK